MVAGAAGDDQHLAHAVEHFGAVGAEQSGLDAARGGQHFQRIGQGHRLLEDFLLHVMAVLAEFDGICRKVRLGDRPLDRRAIHPRDAVTGAGEFGAIAVVEIDDAPRHLDQRRSVGGRVMPMLGDAEQQRRTFARDDDTFGIVLAHHGDGISSLQLGDGGTHGSKQIRLAAQFERDQVRHDLGVGVRGKHVTRGLQAGAQFLVVLDDAVMHHGQAVGDVRVRVALARDAVRRPAGVGDAGRAGGPGLVDLRHQFGDAPDRAQAAQAGGIDQGQPGRIVTAVFELAQPFEKLRNDIAVGDRGNDATHTKNPKVTSWV